MPFEIVRQNLCEVTADAVVRFVSTGTGVRVLHRGSLPPGFMAKELEFAFTPKAVILIEVSLPQGGDGEFNPALLLTQAYRQALTAAVREHCGSVAILWPKFSLPGISEDDLLSILVQGERELLTEQELWVTLVVEDVRRLRLSDSLINAVSRYIKDHYIQALPREKTGHILAKVKNFIAPVEAELEENEELTDIPAEETCLFKEQEEAQAPSDKFYAEPKMRSVDPRLFEQLIAQHEESFSESLLRMIDERGMSDPQVYKRANLNRKLFSKIRIQKDYRPSKTTALALAIALELNLDELKVLIGRAGYALTHASKLDIIVEYFIGQGIYDLFQINEVLFAFDQPLLGGRSF